MARARGWRDRGSIGWVGAMTLRSSQLRDLIALYRLGNNADVCVGASLLIEVQKSVGFGQTLRQAAPQTGRHERKRPLISPDGAHA